MCCDQIRTSSDDIQPNRGRFACVSEEDFGREYDLKEREMRFLIFATNVEVCPLLSQLILIAPRAPALILAFACRISSSDCVTAPPPGSYPLPVTR